jgi:cell wall-associated NlpC family hydrolase
MRSTRLRAVLLALTLACGLVVGFGSPAQATPTASSIEDQIDAKFAALEPTLENWDAVHEQLQKQQAQALALQQKIDPLALTVQLKLARVADIAASIYEAGPNRTMSTLLVGGASTLTLNVLGTVEEEASQQRADVASAVQLRDQYRKQEAPIVARITSLQQQQVALDAQKVVIQKQIDALDKERLASGFKQAAVRPVACPQVYTGDAGSRAARFACNQLGKWYVWDADGPNTFDCSGLTLASWRTVGVIMPHSALQQSQDYPEVAYKNLKPGDLVFYYHPVHHVTIYVGNGWVVSAPATGEQITMRKVFSGSGPNGAVRP